MKRTRRKKPDLIVHRRPREDFGDRADTKLRNIFHDPNIRERMSREVESHAVSYSAVIVSLSVSRRELTHGSSKEEKDMANDTASDDCKRTIRVTRGRVRVNDGQHLHYFVTAEGSKPVFSLSCTHKTHFDAGGLGPPKKNYEVIWERSSADEGPNDDGEFYAFSMSFVATLKYTLRVELHDGSHNVVGDGVIVDADYESDDSEMSCNEAWVVRTKPRG